MPGGEKKRTAAARGVAADTKKSSGGGGGRSRDRRSSRRRSSRRGGGGGPCGAWGCRRGGGRGSVSDRDPSAVVAAVVVVAVVVVVARDVVGEAAAVAARAAAALVVPAGLGGRVVAARAAAAAVVVVVVAAARGGAAESLVLGEAVLDDLLGVFSRGARVGEDEEVLVVARAVGEAKGVRGALDAAQGLAAVAREEGDGGGGYFEDGAVVAVARVVDDGLAGALLEEPAQVVPAAGAVALVAAEAGEAADVLDDAAGGGRELAPRRALGPEGVAEVLLAEEDRVRAPVLVVLVAVDSLDRLQLARRLVDAVAGVLVLDGGHGLELRAAPRRQRPEDAQLLAVARLLRARLRKEHEHAPLLLHRPQRLAVPAHHEPDAVRRDPVRREVVAPTRAQVDRHGAHPLLPDELDVVLRIVALLRRPVHRDRQSPLVQLDLRPAHPRDLPLRRPAPAQHEGRVVLVNVQLPRHALPPRPLPLRLALRRRRP
eukprot:CAMPEP_0197410834 /NCGR_PEP_ID=MMETSP1165-20131217/31656_1 /TAXON_ID=284809 /ORGANISM="Chrysocystis fragilis, Strain CCMP3189" /LENGTH=485 /DNA_ID=CAMNT_0042937341 /DNA_START=358 /DNA_END=1813 /DNA_ORIENTATION=+